MASGLYLVNDETVMVDYGTMKIPLSRAQYRANGYKPAIEKLMERPPRCGKSPGGLSASTATFAFTATARPKSKPA